MPGVAELSGTVDGKTLGGRTSLDLVRAVSHTHVCTHAHMSIYVCRIVHILSLTCSMINSTAHLITVVEVMVQG